MKRLAVLALAILALGMGGGPYRFSRPVEARPGWSVLELPDDVLDACRPGLPDLRLAGDGDKEIAYAFERRTALTTTRVGLVDVETAPGRETTAIADRGPRPSAVSWLSVDVPDEPFLKPIVIEASDDRAGWRQIAEGSIFATDGARMTTVRFQPSDRRYLRLRLDDRNGAPVRPQSILVRSGAIDAPPPREIPLTLDPLPSEDARVSVYAAVLPANNLPLVAVRLAAADPAFARRVRVYERVFARDEISRRLLGQGVVSRSASGAIEDRVSVGDASGRVIEIEVDEAGSPPLSLTSAVAVAEPRRILFFGPASGGLTLLYGSEAAPAPRYDLDAAIAAGRPGQLGAAVLGKPLDAGARASAVPPPGRGAKLDEAAWRSRHPIRLPAGGGVAYLDLAGALASDGSVRIVDADGLQVPFVFETSGHRVQRSVELAIARRGSHTIATISGLDPKDRIDTLELGARAPAYFARQVSVSEELRDARGPTGRRVLGSAFWERRPEAAATPLEIHIASPSGGAVEVDIDDGDNAPLSLSGGAVSWVLRRIDFVYERGDVLALLSDNPAAQAPRYDLALLSAKILAAPAQAAKLGSAAVAPAAQPAGSRWLWASVVAAGLLVALALARTLRSE